MSADPVVIVKGYYRYTDIQWEWHQLIPDPAEVSALKAFVSNNSLGHPDNPLRKEGKDGIELFIGTMPSGQARLLFSSAQIEYVRYWLHAMRFTKSLLPLPSSDFLLTESTLRNVSPVLYKNPDEVKKACKVIEKNNKRLKGTDTALMSIRHVFERIRNYWGARVGTWLAIDFEAWEMDHKVLTEFGWSAITWDANGDEQLNEGHLIVKEHDGYRNGKYVPDYKRNYTFGDSQYVNRANFKTQICAIINDALKRGPLFLVFHDSSQDIKYLRSSAIDAPLDGLSYLLTDAVPTEGLFVTDTSDMFAALEGYVGERSGFQRICNLLHISTTYLHNAGNDAHYTLLAMKAMASGNQLDTQREERWPKHTDPKGEGNLKVEFQDWEEEEEYSDTEGLMADANFPRADLVEIDGLHIADLPDEPVERLWP